MSHFSGRRKSIPRIRGRRGVVGNGRAGYGCGVFRNRRKGSASGAPDKCLEMRQKGVERNVSYSQGEAIRKRVGL
jgi:hypothetical protein